MMSATNSPIRFIRDPCSIQAQQPIRTATHNPAVVIILAVILPAALVTNLIIGARLQSRVSTAGTRIQG